MNAFTTTTRSAGINWMTEQAGSKLTAEVNGHVIVAERAPVAGRIRWNVTVDGVLVVSGGFAKVESLKSAVSYAQAR